MAILKSGSDEYEVRIKRYPEKTYFDEYVKTGDREEPSATSCDRYIVGEDGVRYTIEVTLKKGFSFGDYEVVRARLFIPGHEVSISENDVHKPEDFENGIKSDMTTELQYVDVTVEGSKVLGARFGFRNLLLDEKLVNETDVMGIGPGSLGHFLISVYKLRWKTRRLTDKEYEEKVAAASEIPNPTPQLDAPSVGVDRKQQFLWDAQKVDEDSFKKDGTVYSISFVGGTRKVSNPTKQLPIATKQYIQLKPVAKLPPKISRTEDVPRMGTIFGFNFYYRTSEFLEQTGIVKYPPPLYVYAWKDLDKTERQTALKELQNINKEHVVSALEAKSGKMHAKFGRTRGKDEPKEWRAWSKMSEWEKEEAFESLRKSKKAYERGETIRQYESRNGEIISLVDEDVEKPKEKAKVKSTAKLSSEPEKIIVKVENENLVQKEVNVKNEPIDLEAPVSAPNLGPVPHLANSAEHREATPARIENMDDGELKRKMARAKALAEEIEMEERIVRLTRLKRERRALEEEIEVAESKKKQRHGDE